MAPFPPPVRPAARRPPAPQPTLRFELAPVRSPFHTRCLRIWVDGAVVIECEVVTAERTASGPPPPAPIPGVVRVAPGLRLLRVEDLTGGGCDEALMEVRRDAQIALVYRNLRWFQVRIVEEPAA